jgi:hypothetical protein
MIYFLALIPATVLVVAGYVALYLSQRSDGGLRSFGKYLGFWAFTLAGLVILGAIFAAAHGGRHNGMMRERMAHEMHGPWPGGPRFAGHRFGDGPDNWPPAEAPSGSSGAQPPSGGSAAPSGPPGTGAIPPR